MIMNGVTLAKKKEKKTKNKMARWPQGLIQARVAKSVSGDHVGEPLVILSINRSVKRGVRYPANAEEDVFE